MGGEMREGRWGKVPEGLFASVVRKDQGETALTMVSS
jgi:hypothetical protein